MRWARLQNISPDKSRRFQIILYYFYHIYYMYDCLILIHLYLQWWHRHFCARHLVTMTVPVRHLLWVHFCIVHWLCLCQRGCHRCFQVPWSFQAGALVEIHIRCSFSTRGGSPSDFYSAVSLLHSEFFRTVSHVLSPLFGLLPVYGISWGVALDSSYYIC